MSTSESGCFVVILPCATSKQGAIAKFGTVPISDIAAYFELRNSKVMGSFVINSVWMNAPEHNTKTPASPNLDISAGS